MGGLVAQNCQRSSLQLIFYRPFACSLMISFAAFLTHSEQAFTLSHHWMGGFTSFPQTEQIFACFCWFFIFNNSTFPRSRPDKLAANSLGHLSHTLYNLRRLFPDYKGHK